MITTAVFGGSFDPVHNEHINIAKAAVKELRLKKLVILPTSNPPHKKASNVDFWDRVEMTKLAFVNVGVEVVIDTLENDNKCINFIVNNLPKLKEKYGEFYYIMGGDSLRDIEKWYKPDEIIKNFDIAVFNRTGCIDIKNKAQELNEKYNGKIKVMNYVGLDVDSHTIRNRLLLNLPSSDIPDAIFDYINSKKLYNNYSELLSKAEVYYYEQRFYHAKNTTLTALYFNNVCGLKLDFDKVFVSALLHDVGKKCDKTGVPSDIIIPNDAKELPVQHQFVGAEIAKRDFNILDDDMLNAIRYHTTGRENMSTLEKLIFIADFLSFEREYDGIEEIRELTKQNFDKGFLTCLQRGYNFVLDSGKTLYPLTKKALDFYKE